MTVNRDAVTSRPRRDRFRIEIKVTEAQKDLIFRAAAQQKQGMSEFVRASAEKAARDILKAG